MRPGWNIYFMIIAKIVSLRSTCNARKVGAVIVRDRQILATGYNGAVTHADHCIDMGPQYCFRREMKIANNNKYDYCVGSHAEANAITQAAKLGIALNDSIMYTTLEPCNWCFKMMIQAGIRKFYYELEYESPDKEFDNIWREQFYKKGIIDYPERIIIDDTILTTINSHIREGSIRKLAKTF